MEAIGNRVKAVSKTRREVNKRKKMEKLFPPVNKRRRSIKCTDVEKLTRVLNNTAFGQSSGISSLFESQSLFGQTSNSSRNNPYAPSRHFGTSTGSSIFGSTSTGVFGAPQAFSPFGSTLTFGASSSPAFGSSTPTFGAIPASSPFGGFKNSFQAFNSAVCFTPSFGNTSMPAFGVTSTPMFGASPTPTFGNTGFGSGGAFGASSTPAFGASGTPAFGASSTPAFGASSTPSFGASNTSSFSFGSSLAFGQSTSTFGSNTFGSTPSPFGGAQASTPTFGTSGFGQSPFGSQQGFAGAQASTPTFGTSGFGQSPFGSQQGGSRAVPYAPTVEAETGSGQNKCLLKERSFRITDLCGEKESGPSSSKLSDEEEDDTSETKKQKKKHKYGRNLGADLRYLAEQHKKQAAQHKEQAILLTEMADRWESTKTERVVHNQRDEACPSAFSGAGFDVFIEKSYLTYLQIRKSVAIRDYMPRKTTWLKINHPDGKRSWEVCYKVDTGSYIFCGGWIRLCNEYPVVLGDTCNFTFVRPNELRLVVSKQKTQ